MCLGALLSKGHRSPGKELLFWGDHMGEPEPAGRAIGEAEAPQSAGRGNRPEAVPKTRGQTENARYQTDSLIGTERRRVKANYWIVNRVGAAEKPGILRGLGMAPPLAVGKGVSAAD